MLRRQFISAKAKAQLKNEITAFLPGHVVERPEHCATGVIFASPHSGSLYPESFIERTSLDLFNMRVNEDMYVDELMRPIAAEAVCLTARFPRCYVDLNRAPDEYIDPKVYTPGTYTARAQAGLGVIPTHINEAVPLYDKPLTALDVKMRLEMLYHPYHNTLRSLLHAAKTQFGQALLVDCHSMPGFAPLGVRRPDIILGDRFGKSCHPETLKFIRERFERAGYSVGINYPYAGGFITRQYGQPEDSVEAIQIEINRDLYMNTATQKKKRSFDKVQADLTDLFGQIIHALTPQRHAAQ